MTYCLNPVCSQPQNSDSANICQTCGSRLLLGDRYRPLKLLGQGGFGKTFLAVDEIEPEHFYCVIKQSLPRRPGEPPRRTIELFQQEAERLAELGQHPQIPHLIGHFEYPEEQYLVQEFISGQNLEDILTKEGVFDESRIRKVLIDLLPVLQFIHQHQVIHRDIKPENIICSGTGASAWAQGNGTGRFPREGNRLVLVDFGASKYATAAALARTGTVIGSAGYVAPEQAMGKAELTSDLYSLGVTCIHLLTGLHPFDLYSVSDDRWVWQDYLIEPISDPLKRVLNRLLQKATSQRYRSANAVLQDLKRVAVSARRVALRDAASSNSYASTAAPRRLASKRAEPWQAVQTLIGHAGAVTAIATSPDGSLIASGSSDKTIKLWDLATGELVHTFAGRSFWFSAGHTDRIRALTFSPDGQILISSSDDGALKWWDVATRKVIKTLPDHGWVVSAIAVSENGQLLVSGGSDSAIYVWDLETGELIDTLRKHREQVSALVLSPNGQTLASGSYDKTIRLWNLGTNRLINTLKGHSDRISAIAITSDWLTLVSSSWDKTLKLWDLGLGKQVRTLAGHTDRVNCVAISPDDQIVASGGEDSTIRLWTLEGDRNETSQNYRPTVVQHAWGINALSFSPDSQFLISGSGDETIKIWKRQ